VSAKDRERVVRQYLEPYDGVDFLSPVRQAIARRQALGDEDAFASMGPAWQVIAPEIDWDVSGIVGEGPMKKRFHGQSELLDFWAEWLEVWDAYVYSVSTVENCGEWVIAAVAIEAHARGGVPVDVTIAQAFAVREGRVAEVRVFTTMADARAALGPAS
jgi:ketosteroid isomerase-like protein